MRLVTNATSVAKQLAIISNYKSWHSSLSKASELGLVVVTCESMCTFLSFLGHPVSMRQTTDLVVNL